MANRAAAGLDDKDDDQEENGDDRQEEDDFEDLEGEGDDEDVIIIQSAYRNHGFTFSVFLTRFKRYRKHYLTLAVNSVINPAPCGRDLR